MDPIDYDRGARVYKQYRTLSDSALEEWRLVVSKFALSGGGRAIDVGCGTGQFLRPLSKWLNAAVIGIEPSEGMRDESRRKALPGRVSCIAGIANALPFADETVDVVWLSAVIHQIPDLALAIHEMRRVLRPGGYVLVRGYFADLPVGWLFRHFPGMDRVQATFPTTRDVLANFEQAGFTTRSVTSVREVWRIDLRNWLPSARVLRDFDSSLRLLRDDEFEAGIAELENQADSKRGEFATGGVLNLIVLQRD